MYDTSGDIFLSLIKIINLDKNINFSYKVTLISDISGMIINRSNLFSHYELLEHKKCISIYNTMNLITCNSDSIVTLSRISGFS